MPVHVVLEFILGFQNLLEASTINVTPGHTQAQWEGGRGLGDDAMQSLPMTMYHSTVIRLGRTIWQVCTLTLHKYHTIGNKLVVKYNVAHAMTRVTGTKTGGNRVWDVTLNVTFWGTTVTTTTRQIKSRF